MRSKNALDNKIKVITFSARFFNLGYEGQGPHTNRKTFPAGAAGGHRGRLIQPRNSPITT